MPLRSSSTSPSLPGCAVVVGKPRAQLYAAFVGVDLVAVLHEQQPARGEPAKKEAGVGLTDAWRLGRLGPRAAAVGRGRLHDALRRPREHPQRFVSPLDDHVLMPVGIGKLHRTPPLPGRALVGRNKHIRTAERVDNCLEWEIVYGFLAGPFIPAAGVKENAAGDSDLRRNESQPWEREGGRGVAPPVTFNATPP